jgi:hypothetical protein
MQLPSLAAPTTWREQRAQTFWLELRMGVMVGAQALPPYIRGTLSLQASTQRRVRATKSVRTRRVGLQNLSDLTAKLIK